MILFILWEENDRNNHFRAYPVAVVWRLLLLPSSRTSCSADRKDRLQEGNDFPKTMVPERRAPSHKRFLLMFLAHLIHWQPAEISVLDCEISQNEGECRMRENECSSSWWGLGGVCSSEGECPWSSMHASDTLPTMISSHGLSLTPASGH